MGNAKKLVCRVGINDADYVVKKYEWVINNSGKRVRKLIWMCPFHSRWVNMLKRCHSVKLHERHPTYRGCEVCDEWKVFSNFKKWMETQDWEGKQLDKDLLLIGNKVYSPDTCLFVTPKVNVFITDSSGSRGEWPIGVVYHKYNKKYQSFCRNPFTRKQEYLGSFDTPEEAHEAWKKRKRELSLVVTDDKMLQELLIRRYE